VLIVFFSIRHPLSQLAFQVFLSRAKLWFIPLPALLSEFLRNETLIAAGLSLWRAPFCRATAAILKTATTSQQEIAAERAARQQQHQQQHSSNNGKSSSSSISSSISISSSSSSSII